MLTDILHALGLLPLDGRFSCDEQITSGQCSRSFFGTDQHTGEKVHIKMLLFPRSDSEIARFHNEAFALKEIGKYPMGGNVPRLISAGSALEGELLFIVTEKAVGQTLDSWLSSAWKEATLERRIDIFHRVAAALSPGSITFAHRDFHPGNVLMLDEEPCWHGLVPDPKTLVLDWGQAYAPLLAGFDDSPDFALTLRARVPKELIGSFYSMSPDVFRPHREAIDNPAKHDAWALGLILHKLLLGKDLLSFDGIGDYVIAHTTGELADIVSAAADRINELDSPARFVLSRLFRKLTAINPTQRFDPATAGRVMWDIRVEGFAPTTTATADSYIRNPHDYVPDKGWKFSQAIDYD